MISIFQSHEFKVSDLFAVEDKLIVPKDRALNMIYIMGWVENCLEIFFLLSYFGKVKSAVDRSETQESTVNTKV